MQTRPIRTTAAALAILAIASCSERTDLSAPLDIAPALDLVDPPDAFCGASTTVALVADGSLQVGTVRVVNDGDDLYVTYETGAGFPIGKTALFVGRSAAAIPTNPGGSPRVGHFPYGGRHRSGPHEVTWRVPLQEAGEEFAVIAAFAEAGQKSEGAWAEGTPINPQGGWATYFVHVVQSCGTLVDRLGGTVTLDEAVELDIPPDALSGPTLITIQPSSSSHPQAIGGTVFEFGPALDFAVPALLTLTYDPDLLPHGVPRSAIRPFGENAVFALLPFVSHELDGEPGAVTFEVDHFSIYGLAYLAADLAIEATATPNPARLSDDITIDFVVRNTGSPAAAVENAQVVITLSGLPFIRDFLPPFCTPDGQVGPNGETSIYCETGPLGPDDRLEFQMTGSPFQGLGPGTMLIEAEILPVEPAGYYDTNPGNSAVVLPIEVFPDVSADLRMTAFGPGAPRQAGLERTLTATAENQATSLDAIDATLQFHFKDAGPTRLAVITDQLPDGCVVTQVSSETKIDCALGSLAPGAQATRQVVVRPLDVALYPVDANVLPIAGDPTPGNNTIIGGLQATATVADLVARITATSGQIEVGETVGFSAWAQHLSGDMLPQGTLRIEIEGGATVDHVDVRCDEVDVFPFLVALNCPLPQLQAGESSNTFLVTVRATTGEEITGHARLLLPSYVQDTDASNNAEDATVTVGGVQPAGTLVFSSNRTTMNDLAQLFTKNLATGTVTPITVLQNYTDAVWSPDGTRIAAIRGNGLWLMDADGTNAVEYNLASRDDIIGIGSPSWSPDGSKIVFHGVFDFDAGQDRELWVFDVATTGVTRLTNNNVNDEFPDWSPLGTSILYTVDGTQLWTIEPNGTNPLQRLAGVSVLHPVWAPDGVHVAFTRLRAVGSSIDVLAIDDPTNITTLVNDGRANLKPAWSPDGVFIGFARDQVDNDESFDLWFIRADGTAGAQVLEAILNASTYDVDWK